jgi:hypothetical protein
MLDINYKYYMANFLAPSSTVNYKHVVIVNGGGQYLKTYKKRETIT